MGWIDFLESDEERYQGRAEEARTIASGMTHADSRGIMLRLAKDYEDMAKQVVEMKKQKPK